MKPQCTTRAAALLGLILLTGAAGSAAQTQSGEAPQPSPTRPPTPQWQIDAGGKMEFEVTSVKPDTAAPSRQTVNSNIPLGPQDAFTPTGGLLSATNWPLLQYLIFAYKLTFSQIESVRSQLPKWATAERFDIQARAPGNPTKDQYRLMMQALLADRFKLAVHYETKQLPVYALVLDKPGKMGPGLRVHPADSPCSTALAPPGSGPPATVAGGFPQLCGAVIGSESPAAPGQVVAGARNISMAMLAASINVPFTGIDRPVLDQTGITGNVDFTIHFTPEINGPLPPNSTFKPDETGPTAIEALEEQLGLKLESTKGPVDVIVLDHVEPPDAD